MVQEVKREESGDGGGDKWRQYVSSLSVLCVTVLIGLPLWWKTTEVYRCPLPYDDIHSLSSQQIPPMLLYTISIMVLHNDEKETSFVARLQQELDNQTVKSEITLSYLIQPLYVESEVREKIKKAVYSDASPSLTSLLPPSVAGHYSIIVVPAHSDSRVILSTSRWAIIHTTADNGDSVIIETVRVIKSMVIEDKMLKQALDITSGTWRGRGRGRGRENVKDMRQVQAAQGYQLSFTLLVPDPSLVRMDWNIEQATNSILMPFLNHPGIATLANFTISSQIFHYTDLKLRSVKSSSYGYYVSSSSLPPMISSVESKLGSLVSQLPSLNFLVLVPQLTHSPMLIKDAQDQSTDNFLVPQWGGVVFYNPPEWGNHDDDDVIRKEVMLVKMEGIMSVFVHHLQLLLGLPETTEHSLEVVPEHGSIGIAEWKMDQLLVARMLEYSSMATTSLISLVKLLDKVKNMIISDIIQHEVEAALAHLHECYRLCGEGNLNEAYSYAQHAMVAAETAFFDPSILELLYFPDDQKFAIYIPLFLPISIPIVMSSVAAFQWIKLTLTRSKHTPTK